MADHRQQSPEDAFQCPSFSFPEGNCAAACHKSHGEQDSVKAPDNYTIFKDHAMCSNHVSEVYRVKRIEPSESMQTLAAGRGLCMCCTMGKCPLIAELHEPPCSMCTDPFITRYYPSDTHWWSLHNKVKELREVARVENETA